MPRLKILVPAISIFLSAFLLFQIQLICAKFLLPTFGGVANVWITCLMFFQIALLAGYTYSHLIVRYLRLRTQAIVHMIFLGLCVLNLYSILPTIVGAQSTDSPISSIFGILLKSVGLPCIVLSASSPLFQTWFGVLNNKKNTYRLYALSNLGSLLALVSYPLAVEVILSRHLQIQFWIFLFALFSALTFSFSVMVHRNKKSDASLYSTEKSFQDSKNILWFIFPLCSSILLLAFTNRICQDVASIPFLWVLPLVLYLLSFILCFYRPHWYSRRIFHLLFFPSMLALYICEFYSAGLQLPILLTVFLFSFFVCCMICHGELFRLRPPGVQSTSFLLSISSGGVIGSIIVVFIAPLVFDEFYEFQLGISLCAVLLWWTYLREKKNIHFLDLEIDGSRAIAPSIIALLVLFAFQGSQRKGNTILQVRNFYGVFRVKEMPAGDREKRIRSLLVGDILHGIQFVENPASQLAAAYYYEETGVGRVFQILQANQNLRVGVIGLGIGTLAAYGRLGDYFRFYEINPDINKLAQSEFKYLSETQATVDVVVNDARLALAKEPPQSFDLLVLDAFSSDAVPAHLLTFEAWQIYLKHLKPDGVIAVNTSNRYLDLSLVARDVAHQLGFTVVKFGTRPSVAWQYPCEWVIATKNQNILIHEKIQTGGELLSADAKQAIWSDEHFSLLSALK